MSSEGSPQPSTSGAGFQTPIRSRRRRSSSLHDTPRSAASTLGRSRAPREPYDAEAIEMNLFDTTSPRSPPPTDPMEELYQEVSVGEVGYTQSIEQDLEVLKESGFIINTKKGFLGNGFYGEVFKGVYGPNVRQKFYIAFNTYLI